MKRGDGACAHLVVKCLATSNRDGEPGDVISDALRGLYESTARIHQGDPEKIEKTTIMMKATAASTRVLPSRSQMMLLTSVL